MNCPVCGFEPVFGRDAEYMDATICQCPQCHHRWIQLGRRQRLLEELDEQSKALREWWQSLRIYCYHGFFIWPIFSLIHFLVVVPHPLQILASFRLQDAGIVLGLAAAAGVFLGYALLAALNWTSRLWPTVGSKMHVLVPLLIAAFIGGLYGDLLYNLGEGDLDLRNARFSVRGESISVLLGAALGMLVTPIIIVRSSKVRARKGLREPLPEPKDPRWNG